MKYGLTVSLLELIGELFHCKFHKNMLCLKTMLGKSLENEFEKKENEYVNSVDPDKTYLQATGTKFTSFLS